MYLCQSESILMLVLCVLSNRCVFKSVAFYCGEIYRKPTVSLQCVVGSSGTGGSSNVERAVTHVFGVAPLNEAKQTHPRSSKR